MVRAVQTSNLSPAPIPRKRYALPAGMVRREFRAMGTTIELLLPQGLMSDDVERGGEVVQHLFSRWEQTLSRFQFDSELSRLNRAAGRPVKVSPLLLDVLQTALTAARATGGMFDPTLLSQIVSMGYDRSFDMLPLRLPDSIAAVTPGGNWRKIQIDTEQQCVTLPENVGLDFGGIAKGMAVDAALRLLKGLPGIESTLVNAGGDLAVMGLPPDADHWSIGVEGNGKMWSVPLRRGAMATSGVARRHWQQGGLRRHHLIDPRTGESARNALWSVTVAAERCEQAEVAAKVAFLLGPEQGGEFLCRHGLSGLFLLNDGGCIAAGSWPENLMKTIIEEEYKEWNCGQQ